MFKFITVCLCFVASYSLLGQGVTLPPSGNNQKAKVTQWMGPVEVTISYSSPDVHADDGTDRKGHIWGELVPYGMTDPGFGTSKSAPWRAGANENTVITFSHDVTINGKNLKAGKYGLFLIVEKDKSWTWIFSTNATSWGHYFYSEKEDALRVAATPQEAAYTEYLTYGFDDRKPSSTTAYLQWENKRVSFAIDVPNIHDVYIAALRDELRGGAGFTVDNLVNAANYCVENKTHLSDGLVWADMAINTPFFGRKNFTTMSCKARVLEAMGKSDEANALLDEAIKLPGTSVQDIHQYGRALLNAGKKEKALEVFQYNFKTHPEDKFTTNVGMARGMTAMGNKKEAIKYWETAIKNIPAEQKANVKMYQAELDKLKK